jgi:prepilin-type N-terminal cleavage/methylation domain-containing protein
MNRIISRRCSGFSLVEIAIVIVVLVLLAALSFSGYNYASRRSAEMATEVQIAALSNGIENYHSDLGRVPSHEVVSGLAGTGVVYQSLYQEGADSGGRIYVAGLGPDSTEGWTDGEGDNAKIIDAWGNELRYRTGAAAANPDFDLWSEGADGRTNPEDQHAPESLDDMW